MQSSNSTHFKIINTHLILAMLFSIITALFIFSCNSLIVHASSNVTNSGTTNEGWTTIIEGASYTKQFWLVHLVDENGTNQTNVVMFTCDGMKADMSFLMTRPEHGLVGYSRVMSNPPFGWAYDEAGHSRADAIKAWMTSNNSFGVLNMVKFVENVWGTEWAEMFADPSKVRGNKRLYLCIEDGMWCGFYNDGGYTGQVLAATAYGWATLNKYSQAMEDWEESNGDAKISLYTNNILPNAVKLQFAQTGVAVPTKSGRLLNDEIRSAGYGMAIFWVEDGATHTWDSENLPSTEGPAPLPPTGGDGGSGGDGGTGTSTTSNTIYTIIKSYRLKTPTGYIDKGTFMREETVSKITIEDEPLNSTDKNYKVKGWKQSSTKLPSISSLSWESSVPQIIGETGSSAGFTTLDLQHKILYVLLEANKEDTTPAPTNYNYILSESSITRQIDYSNPDYPNGNIFFNSIHTSVNRQKHII